MMFSFNSNTHSFLAILLILANFQEGLCEICSYLTADMNGNNFTKGLSNVGIKISIHGEWTYHQTGIDKKDCDQFDSNMINPPRLWYSFNNLHNKTSCCHLQFHECLKHRKNDEDVKLFATRVLTTCTKFNGKIIEIICRYDEENGFNIVNQLVLESAPSESKQIKLFNCESSKPFKTYWGVEIDLTDQVVTTIDVMKESITFSQQFEYLRNTILSRQTTPPSFLDFTPSLT
ncbi:hypothetical protein HZS_1457 [Henneguya salminicola]|nr:hypothetical protein HZS_1457 [Henneguya salminicola]